MIPRPGLCINDDATPQRIGWRKKIAPAFFLSPDPTGHLSLACMQGSFMHCVLDFYHGRWMTTEQWLHCMRREQIDRQKTRPWKYREEKWDGVKVCVLPRTDPDGLVVDSNTAIVLDRKKYIAGSVIVRGGRPLDCDYEALAHMIGHDAARECFHEVGRSPV